MSVSYLCWKLKRVGTEYLLALLVLQGYMLDKLSVISNLMTAFLKCLHQQQKTFEFLCGAEKHIPRQMIQTICLYFSEFD